MMKVNRSTAVKSNEKVGKKVQASFQMELDDLRSE